MLQELFLKNFDQNFENHLFLSRGTADCELVDTDIALNIKYVLENYFWSIETSLN